MNVYEQDCKCLSMLIVNDMQAQLMSMLELSGQSVVLATARSRVRSHILRYKCIV